MPKTMLVFLIALVSATALAKEKLPAPLMNLGPNSDGQRWSIYFKPGGIISAVSTCKPQDRQADPKCRYIGSGVWSRKEGMVCYTIQEWGGNTSFAGPEHCEAER